LANIRICKDESEDSINLVTAALLQRLAALKDVAHAGDVATGAVAEEDDEEPPS
jgi:hypothetical protein